MKYLPFVFCSVLFLVGFNIFFRNANGYGIMMMTSGAILNAFWAAVVFLDRMEDEDRLINLVEARVTAIESRPAPKIDDDLKKHIIALEMRITELDSRVSGNDPFGG